MSNVKSYIVGAAVIFGFASALNAATRHQNVSQQSAYGAEQVVSDSGYAASGNFQDQFKGY